MGNKGSCSLKFCQAPADAEILEPEVAVIAEGFETFEEGTENSNWEAVTSPTKSTTTYRIVQEHLELNSPSHGGMGHPDEDEFLDGLQEAETSEERREMLLKRIEHLVDTAYDILKAEELMLELEAECREATEEWGKVKLSSMYTHYRRRLHYFREVGRSYCADTSGWFTAFQDSTGMQMITGVIDKQNPNNLEYRVKALIGASLPHALAIANEIELMPSWNSLVVGTPEVIGRRTAHYMVLHYQMSLVGGMYKVDVLNEVRRFTDPDGGFMAEYIESVPEDHPSYMKCPSGYKRPQTKIKNVWIACGPKHTMLIQFGLLTLPFAASKWLASTVGGLAGRSIVGGLVKNSIQAAVPGNKWEAAFRKDEFGLYARLRECAEADASDERDPAKGIDLKQSIDLTPFFERHGNRPRRKKGKDMRVTATGSSATGVGGTMTYMGA